MTLISLNYSREVIYQLPYSSQVLQPEVKSRILRILDKLLLRILQHMFEYNKINDIANNLKNKYDIFELGFLKELLALEINYTLQLFKIFVKIVKVYHCFHHLNNYEKAIQELLSLETIYKEKIGKARKYRYNIYTELTRFTRCFPDEYPRIIKEIVYYFSPSKLEFLINYRNVIIHEFHESINEIFAKFNFSFIMNKFDELYLVSRKMIKVILFCTKEIIKIIGTGIKERIEIENKINFIENILSEKNALSSK